MIQTIQPIRHLALAFAALSAQACGNEPIEVARTALTFTDVTVGVDLDPATPEVERDVTLTLLDDDGTGFIDATFGIGVPNADDACAAARFSDGTATARISFPAPSVSDRGDIAVELWARSENSEGRVLAALTTIHLSRAPPRADEPEPSGLGPVFRE